jgi:glycosyltransferase involved in cell wall biosynthesis
MSTSGREQSDAPRITVGIVFFNRRELLREAVRSIFAQTFADWELLLVDDGSTDGSVEWARSLAALDPDRVRVLCDGRNRRYPARLNQIARAARGAYIARMDDDDLSAPERLARQAAFLESRPEVDLVGTDLVSLDAAGSLLGKRGLPADHAAIVRTVYTGARLAHGTSMGRREFFLENAYSEGVRLVADYDFWLRSHGRAYFANITVPLYFYREGHSFQWGTYARVVRNKITQMTRIARERGGWGRVLPAVLKEAAKLCVCTAFCAAGMGERFFGRRHRPLSAAEREKAARDLEAIHATVLPGEDR